jgi:hypothetical protein
MFSYDLGGGSCEACAIFPGTLARYMFDAGFEPGRVYLNCQHLNSKGISWTNY